MVAFRKATVVGMIVGAVASAASGQWMFKTPPASSPYWWTLTDELKPRELRRLLIDKTAHRERYLQAVATGEASPLTTEELSDLSYFVNGQFTPELVRLAEAFDSFMRDFKDQENWFEQTQSRLRKYELSPSGQASILALVEAYNTKRDEMVPEVGELAKRFVEIMATTERASSRKELKGILKRKSLREMSRISGIPLEEVQQCALAWERDVVEELCYEALGLLSTDLSQADWDAFRRYLLNEVAPGMVIIGRDDDLVEGSQDVSRELSIPETCGDLSGPRTGDRSANTGAERQCPLDRQE